MTADGSTRWDTIDTVPEFAGVRDALRAGDWAAAEAELRAMPSDVASYAIALIGEVDGVEQLLDDAVRATPDSACARTALAVRWIALGWQVRSGARAENVSPEQFEGFRRWLVAAEQQLVAACAIDGSYAPAWGARVLTARALEVGVAEARRRFERVRRLSPHDFPAEVHMLEYVLPKWAGSDEEAHAFARERMEDAPPGAHSGALVAVYHIEGWLERDGGDPGAAYLAQSRVVDELADAAARSVLHPDYVGGPIAVQAHSAFAMAFWLAGRREEAVAHFVALDGRATDFPWTFAFDDPAGLDGVRAAVLGARGRDGRT